jgi:hypothetical protein
MFSFGEQVSITRFTDAGGTVVASALRVPGVRQPFQLFKLRAGRDGHDNISQVHASVGPRFKLVRRERRFVVVIERARELPLLVHVLIGNENDNVTAGLRDVEPSQQRALRRSHVLERMRRVHEIE